MKRFIVVALSGLLAACANQETSENHAAMPTWLQTKIKQESQQPLTTATQAIWKISHRGQSAYFLQSPCCDQFNPLLDQNGKLLCHPAGGISGKGDGRCPKPADVGTQPQLIWSHPQSENKTRDVNYLIDDGKKDATQW